MIFHSNYIKAKDNQNKFVATNVDRGDRDKDKFVPNKGHEFKGEHNQTSSFYKSYEEKKRVTNHDIGCYLCGETTHFARLCHSLSKFGPMITTTKKKHATAQAGNFEEQEAQYADP